MRMRKGAIRDTEMTASPLPRWITKASSSPHALVLPTARLWGEVMPRRARKFIPVLALDDLIGHHADRPSIDADTLNG